MSPDRHWLVGTELNLVQRLTEGAKNEAVLAKVALERMLAAS